MLNNRNRDREMALFGGPSDISSVFVSIEEVFYE